MGTPYAISPLTCAIKINRKSIKESLAKARELAREFRDNIGFVPLSSKILDMVEEKKK